MRLDRSDDVADLTTFPLRLGLRISKLLEFLVEALQEIYGQILINLNILAKE